MRLAKALDEGAGVGKDPDEARQWYGKAAEQEHSTAQLELARKYAQVPDCAQAVRWDKEAAMHGQTAAMLELGKLYLGPKCGTDRKQAFVWFTVGARFGSKESQAEAEQLGHALTATQKKSARLTAERWIQEHSGTENDEKDEEEKR